jgi:hypothetical protein
MGGSWRRPIPRSSGGKKKAPLPREVRGLWLTSVSSARQALTSSANADNRHLRNEGGARVHVSVLLIARPPALPTGAFAEETADSVSPAVATASVPVYSGVQQTYVTPEHLKVGGQVFDASVSGFRAYLDTKRTSDPQLFAALDPKVANLESRVAAGRAVFVVGALVGLGSVGYAIFGRKTCTQPPVTDPSFAADSVAWNACNDDNLRTSATFGLIGVGAFALGGVGWWLLAPKRSDLLDLVNTNNAASHDTMRLQLGYDPTSHLALGGFSRAF